MAQINANLTDYEAQEGFDILPPGWYPAEVIDSEIKESKNGNDYVNWTFQILGKPNRVWTTTVLNNDVAMKILKTLATCCGHRNPNYIADTEELHGKRCQIKLKVKTDPNGDYEPKNEIVGFKPLEGTNKNNAAAPSSIPANVPPAHVIASEQQQAAAAPKPKMPWE